MMRYIFILLITLFLLPGKADARGGKRMYRGMPRTEVELMNAVLGCLQYKDSVSYYYLFIPFDTLWHMVLHNNDHTPETVKALSALKEHPQSLIQFDPYYNHDIIKRFQNVVFKAEDSGIHWRSVVMQRYELHKQEPTRDLPGYDVIAPERFQGYMFVRDLLGRRTYCVTITEIQKIQGYFFGGQVINILEANTLDQYHQKEKEEQKYFAWLAKNALLGGVDEADSLLKKDTTALVDDGSDTSAAARKRRLLSADSGGGEDEKARSRKEVVDRKYYEGFFDEEIPVKLFIRYMRGPSSAKVVAYDGLYKFGDQRKYVRLNITKNADSTWLMDDDAPLGTLDLVLRGKKYTGSWTNSETQTGYDAVLQQADLPQVIMEQFEKILDQGLSGRVDEDIEEKKQDEADDANKNKANDRDEDRRETRRERRQRRYEEERKQEEKDRGQNKQQKTADKDEPADKPKTSQAPKAGETNTSKPESQPEKKPKKKKDEDDE